MKKSKGPVGGQDAQPIDIVQAGASYPVDEYFPHNRPCNHDGKGEKGEY